MATNAVTISGWDAEFNGLVLDTGAQGKITANQSSVSVDGAGYRENGVMVMPGTLTTSSGGDVYVKWTPNGSSSHARFFALLIPSGGASTANEVISEGFDAMAFTTHHSYMNSTVVKDGVPYYTRMHFDPLNKNITYTTASSNYDTQGGTVIQTKMVGYDTTSKYDMALWQSYENNSLGFGFGVFDNYAGASASVTLSEVSYSGNTNDSLPSFSDTVKSLGGYYTTFAKVAKAAYHLASDETKGFGDNIVKPYSDVAWKEIGNEFKVLSASDLGVAPSGIRTDYYMLGTEPTSVTTAWKMHGDGIFTGNNAAAFAARTSDALIISFRGTNDNDGQGRLGGVVGTTPDSSDWTNMKAHYLELAAFVEAVDKYIAEKNITKVYVAGHSLGGAMVQAYMKHHANGVVNYEAVTFASAAYDFVASESRVQADRIVSIENVGDPVPMTGDQYGHVVRTNLSGLTHLEGADQGAAYSGTDFHSMDLYMAVASVLDKQLPDTAAASDTMLHGFEKSSFNSSLQTEIYLGASEIPRAWNDPSYEAYQWEGAPSAFAPKFQATSGNDVLSLKSIPDRQSKLPVALGGDGIDTAKLPYTSGGWRLDSAGNEITASALGQGYYELHDVERIAFLDKKVAFDVSTAGNAGKAALFIGAISYPHLKSLETVGSILSIFDEGASMLQLAQAAINTGIIGGLAGSSSNLDLARLAYRNVAGSEAPESVAQELASFMKGSGGNLSQAEFIAAVAQLNANQQHIDLVGLQTSGLEYM